MLAALGGDATPCLKLARAWGRHSDDLRVLAIGPRSAADRLTITAEALDNVLSAHSGPGWSGYAPLRSRAAGGFAIVSASTSRSGGRLGPARRAPGMRMSRPLIRSRGREEDPSRAELIGLLALGAPFQLRLSGAVAHAWSADGPHAGDRARASPVLTAALTGRLAPTAAQWLGIDPARVDASIHDEPGWGEIELARVEGQPGLRANLPVSWLARIWAPGLAVVGGHLVVSVQQAAWPSAQVLALREPGGKLVELSIRHDGRGWSVAA